MLRRLTFTFGVAVLCGLSGCAVNSVSRPTLIETPVSVIPDGSSVRAASRGSLTPLPTVAPREFRGLFAERRPSRVGDTLTVVLDETTRARKDGGTELKRRSDQSLGARAHAMRTTYGPAGQRTVGNLLGGASQDADASIGGGGTADFSGSGGSSASNEFSGTITVTVVQVLDNGNLRVAGEKRLAVGFEEEVIRFGGVVSPKDVNQNSVQSSKVADARLEYRGAGATDSVKQPGRLTQVAVSSPRFKSPGWLSSLIDRVRGE
jgi:flagellar L-ring protein precursor FlgH